MNSALHIVAPAFAHTSGPKNAKIALVGEDFGEQEELTGLPFVGNAGQELSRLLREVSIPRSECFITNTFAARPPDNKLDHWCASKKDVGGKDYHLPALRPGKYIRQEFLGELTRLKEELTEVQPNLAVALGGTALWALCCTSSIGLLRGTTMASTLLPGLKVLPTYHPSHLFKVWSHRPIVLTDLMKARREALFPDIRRPRREILVQPTLGEVSNYVSALVANPPPLLSVDCETRRGQITMLGFAASRSQAIVIDFIMADWTSYWSEEEEVEVRRLINILLSSHIPKLTQNGLYDIQYLMSEGYSLRAFNEDTMLLHHAFYPELQKGLGFLGSIYSNEPAWKLMRGRGEEFKRDA